MLDITKLKDLLDRQDALAKEIAEASEGLATEDILRETEKLKTENEKLQQEIEAVKKENKSLEGSTQYLRGALDSQMSSEKSRLLKNSEEKMCAYFQKNAASKISKLTALEDDMRKAFDVRCQSYDGQAENLRDEMNLKLRALDDEYAARIRDLRVSLRIDQKVAEDTHHDNLRPLEECPINKQAVIAESQNKVERILGLNVLGKIGAVLIIIGMITLAVWLQTFVYNAVIRTLPLFGAALVVLAFGLVLCRKPSKRTIFGTTMLSLGVALFYTVLTIGYFAFHAFTVEVALIICVVITAGAYVLSVWQKSEVVASFAQIGGYLPIITIIQSLVTGTAELAIIYSGMGYFLILSVLGFLLSSRFKWQILNYISFGLNIVAVILVASSVAVQRVENVYSGSLYIHFGTLQLITLLFMFTSFALHTILPMVTNVRTKQRLNKPDFILMTIATAVNLVLFYVMFHQYGIGNFTGLLSLWFALFYFGLYTVSFFAFKTEFRLKTLFWMTGTLFLFLAMPMQFDTPWWSFGWVMYAVALLLYGILRESKLVFRTGVAIGLKSLISFIVVDLIIGWALGLNLIGEFNHNIFVYKYALLTLGAMGILAALCYKKKLLLGYAHHGGKKVFYDSSKSPAQVFAAFVYLNTAAFLLYIVQMIFSYAAPLTFLTTGTTLTHLMLICMIMILFVFATLIPRVFRTVSVHYASIVLAIVSLIFVIVVNWIRLPAFGEYGSTGARVAAIFMLGGVSLASVYVFYDLYAKIAEKVRFVSESAIIIAMTIYFLFHYTQLMLWQFRVPFTSIILSIVYIVTALAALAFGLWKRNRVTRRFALVLTVLALIKIFLIDTWHLDLIFQVINYVVFGVILIAMSFLYQIFYKKLGLSVKGKREDNAVIEPEEDISEK